MSADPEPSQSEERDANFDDLPGDERDALAVTIREVARDRAEDGPGSIE
jgi:hypothetical protein